MEHVFVVGRYNGKPYVTLKTIELAAAKEEPIIFDIFGHLVTYVPERTCEIQEGSGYDDLLEEEFWHLSCGHLVIGPKPDFCSECGARVVNGNE